MPNNAAVLLGHAGQEPRHVHERDQRYVKSVAEADESSGFGGRVGV